MFMFLPGIIFTLVMAGCGGYADDNIGAVSTTGHGESIMRFCLAHAILTLMEQGKTYIYFYL
jgi:beta-aspartyl-peptidase (threonine type)